MRPHVRGGLVENQDAGGLQQGARHAQQLALPGAHVAATLLDRRIQPPLRRIKVLS